MSNEQYDLPDGPGGLPLLNTLRFFRTRSTDMIAVHDKFGDAFTLRILPGPRTLVIFSDPADIKEIFAGDPEYFHAGEGNAILKPVMGDHSVLLTDGAQHHRARKLIMPAFTGGALRGYVPMVEAIAKRAVDSWHDGQRIIALDEMNAITLDIILQVVFGVTDEARLDVLRPKVNRMVDIDSTILLAWLFPILAKIPPWSSYFKNQEKVDELLYAEIAERRRSDVTDRTDVLSRLLSADSGDDGLTDPELRDQLVTLLLAGHETTASALSWTLHELGQDPERLARAIAAADTGDDAYLEACIKEAIRVHPIIDFVARTLKKDQVIGGRRLPRGVTLAPSIMLSHSREDNFADAHLFKPERFLEDKIAPNTWIPFGGGVRRCLGAAFSLMEGTVVLRTILQRYEIHVEQPTPPRLRNITNVPHDKAPVTLRMR